MVTAIAQFGGDYESIKQIQQVSASAVRLSYRADNVPNPLEGLPEAEWRRSSEVERLGDRFAHGSHRGPKERARLYAMVRPQPARSHAGINRHQRFPGGAGRAQGQGRNRIQLPHRRAERHGGIPARRSGSDGGRRRRGCSQGDQRPRRHGQRPLHFEARGQRVDFVSGAAERPAGFVARGACAMHHRRRLE